MNRHCNAALLTSFVVILNLLGVAQMSRLRFKHLPLKEDRTISRRGGRFPLSGGGRNPLPLKNGRDILRINASSHICHTFKFNQTISHSGCHDRVIVNRGCYGYCHTMMHGGVGQGFNLKLTLGCVNDKTKYRPVKLTCPGRRRGYKLKSVLIVKSCKCKSSTPMMRKTGRRRPPKFPLREDTNVK